VINFERDNEWIFNFSQTLHLDIWHLKSDGMWILVGSDVCYS